MSNQEIINTDTDTSTENLVSINNPDTETTNSSPSSHPWIQAYGKSDIGKVREANEDGYLCEFWKDSSEALLVVVADGMGGHRGGKEAADIAIATFHELLDQPLPQEESAQYELLTKYFYIADERIRDEACKSFKLMDMGTTIVAAIFTRDRYISLHAGDCRFYHIRNGKPIIVSEDHSVVQILIELGKIKPEDVATHPMRSVVNSSLGGRNATGQFTISPQSDEDGKSPVFSYESGDIFLLCSDGLHGEVTLEKILEISQNESPEIVTQDLLDTALENGGKDNITVVTIRGGESTLAD